MRAGDGAGLRGGRGMAMRCADGGADGAETVIGAGRRSGRGDCAEMRAETRINGA